VASDKNDKALFSGEGLEKRFDFELSSEQIAATAVYTGVYGGPDPGSITLENYGIEIPQA
jgi:hypothetical protein